MLHLTRGEALWIGLAVLIALRSARRRHRVVFRPDPHRMRTVLLVAGLLVGFGLLAEAAATVLSRDWPTATLPLVLWAGTLVAVAVLFAPDPSPAPGAADERAEVAALVRGPGGDTLAPFALRRDKTYAFSPDGRAAVAYRVVLGTAVAGGDPVGAPGSQQAAADAFAARCVEAGWRIGVLGAGERTYPLWRRHGLRPVGIGDEAVLEVDAFTLASRRMRNVRQAVSRTRNAGVTTSISRPAELGPAVRAELAAVAADWFGKPGERGFSMNLDDLTGDGAPDCVVAIARDAGGRPVGFQRYALVGGGRLLTLDSMPRDRRGPNGVNERLIVDVVDWAREHGADRVSLNFAAFRPMLEARDRSPRERVGHQLLHLLDPMIKVEPLYRFNLKFAPSWQPRAVMYRSWFELPWVVAAAVGMEFALPYDRGHSVRLPSLVLAGPAHAEEEPDGHACP